MSSPSLSSDASFKAFFGSIESRNRSSRFSVLLLLTHCIFASSVPGSWAFCYVGNPQWVGAPEIEIEAESFDSAVLVDWTDIIYNAGGGQGRDCTDNFRVKWWPSGHHTNYSLSELLPPTDRQFTVRGLQKAKTYAFQVIAREDKGSFGIDYNRSPTVYLSLPSNSTTAADKTSAAVDEQEEDSGLHGLHQHSQKMPEALSEKRWKKEMEMLREILDRLAGIEEKMDAALIA